MAISKVDIICTISLTLQILAMLITCIFVIVFLDRISNQLITPEEFIFSLICSDCIIALTTLVDPIVFLVVSKYFRMAVKSIFR